ncbi:hypothetical protein [Salinicoccus albus]|uniref:hypothetical protein n=1 Tax=Salinicoccus albus TaxID=418756 RepID=UPI001B7FC629|nr:hypothetical protein [Salinicoccus albus]
MQKKIPLINSAHGSETRNIINELIKLFNGMGYTYDEALSKAHSVLSEAKKTNDMNEDVQRQLDEIILENGNSEAEVVQARGGLPLLKDRLNNQEEEVNKKSVLSFRHTNLVDKVNSLINVRGMYLKKDSEAIYVGIGMGDGIKGVVEYRFVNNDDGLLLLRGVRSGFEDPIQNKIDVTLDGVFNEGSAPSTFTTAVGDSFNFEFEGSNLHFTSVVESRGGLWEFELSNGMKKNITCYNNNTTIVTRTVFEDLPHQKYKGKATFKGADPFNPPTSSARGYVHYKPADPTVYALNHGKVSPLNHSTSKWVISPNSIPDFAINGTDVGNSNSGVWVPQHGSVKNVSLNVSGRIFADGEHEVFISGTEKNTLEFDYKEVENVKISQTFRANNPNSNLEMWSHIVTHTISEVNPFLTITNNIEVLNDIFSNAGYLGMLPSSPNNMYKLELENGEIYSPIPQDSSERSFDLGVNSAIYVGENTSGRYHAAAMDVTSLKDAINLNVENINSPPGLITFRSDNVSKVYFYFTNKSYLNSGDSFSVTQRIACIFGERYPTVL